MREMFLPYFFVMFLCGIGLGADRSGLTSGSPIIEGLVGSCVGHGGLQFLDLLKGGPVEFGCHGVDHFPNRFE